MFGREDGAAMSWMSRFDDEDEDDDGPMFGGSERADKLRLAKQLASDPDYRESDDPELAQMVRKIREKMEQPWPP